MKNSLIQYNIPIKSYSPLIFSFPHSGTNYNKTINGQTILKGPLLRASEDYCVDKLFSKALDKDTYFIQADFPRCYVDVNRDNKEIDKKLFLDIKDEVEIKETPLSLSGYGVIPRKVSHDIFLYDKPLSIEEYHKRISKVYFDWHSFTEKIINNCISKFGFAFILDCHSMPSDIKETINYKLSDFVIGDLNGKSSKIDFNNKIKKELNLYNYSYNFNKPFSGNFILRKHTNINNNIYGIQLEIRRDLYMKESSLKLKKDNFLKLSNNLGLIFSSFKYYLKEELSLLNVAE